MRARTLALICATSLLGLACDAPTARPDAKSAEREAAVQDDVPAAAADAEPTRDLAQLERELDGNEIKLRELGVAIAAPALADEPSKAEAKSADGDVGDATKDKKSGATKKTKPNQRTSGAAGMAPGSSPSPKPDDAIAGGGGEGRDEVKSIQNPPTDRPNDRPTEQTEEVCPLICSLADSTCELTDEICELADRHTDDDTYSLACERAANDCKLAREACLECLR